MSKKVEDFAQSAKEAFDAYEDDEASSRDVIDAMNDALWLAIVALELQDRFEEDE